VHVRPVESRTDLKRFIDLPYQLHARDPIWVPPLRRDVRQLLSPAKNPFFQHADAQYYLAERNGAVVGRIAAVHNRLHNETHGDRVGFFGFFETIDDQAVADALFDAAATWLSARGLDTMRGPASFSVNDECGLLVDGFQEVPAIMMPHNPPSYVRLTELAGFTKAKDLLVYEAGDERRLVPVPDRLDRAVATILKRNGLTVRPLNLADFENEVERIKRLYNRAWERNWGFVPMTDAEIDHLAEQFKPVVVPDLVPFLEKDGEVVAFGLSLPDLNVAFRKNRSGAFIPGVLRALWMLKRRRISRLRILLLGVIPEFRGKGLDAVLYHWTWTRGNALGYTWGEAGWILEDNPAMNAALEKIGFQRYKTYRLYDRPL
jgi:GNAT superfamily N-acetyltransferase